MITLIKNIHVYAPEAMGKKDILIAGGAIERVENEINLNSEYVEIIDGKGALAVPGYMDQHVHVTGGGGENGFRSRVPEIGFSEFVNAGITTAVGLLGTDSQTRSLEALLAKTRALVAEGMSAYMLTGAYQYPSPSILSTVKDDVAFFPEVIGVKIALADHRASRVDEKILEELGSQARVGGMLGEKAGIVTIHMGEGKKGLSALLRAIENSDLPARHFIPTHVNRSKRLWEETLGHVQAGGFADLSAGMGKDAKLEPRRLIAEAKAKGIALDRITISSDGNGSWSEYDENGRLTSFGAASVNTLHSQVKSLVQEEGFQLSEALPFVTSNVAAALQLTGKKGCLREGADADILLLTPELDIDSVFMKGRPVMREKEILAKGSFE